MAEEKETKTDVNLLKQEAADLFFGKEKMRSQIQVINQRLNQIGNTLEGIERDAEIHNKEMAKKEK